MTSIQSYKNHSHIDRKNDWSNVMSEFNPDRLTVDFRDGVSATGPLIPRNHTLTHSDFTGELFLTIGTHFAWDMINTDMRDEVLGEWKKQGNIVYYNVYVLINDEEDLEMATRRDEIFRRELPLALTAIRYGDRHLFECYSHLDYALVVVNFMSTYPHLSKQESWGTFIDFANGSS